MKTAVLIGLSRHRIGVDGAGVTTLVAFHGCPLNCKYCLNPQALSPKGVWKRYTPDELFRVVSKDDLYFRAILHFHKLCLDNGKHWTVNIETSLNVQGTFVEVVEKLVNHWIVDIKDMNPEIYKAYTGVDNHLVIQNLQYLIEKKAKITVRVPLIPNFNTEADVEKSIKALQKMGIIDIERFTYNIKEH